jgi:hypothetical protein
VHVHHDAFLHYVIDHNQLMLPKSKQSRSLNLNFYLSITSYACLAIFKALSALDFELKQNTE